MTSKERVLTACEFRRPDRIPRFDNFWEYPGSWRTKLGDRWALSDIMIWYPDETPFPTGARSLYERDGSLYEVDGWGRTVRRRTNAYFVETLEVPFVTSGDVDRLVFDSPSLDSRYLTGRMDPSITFRDAAEASSTLALDKSRHCVFGKTGGPYLRSTYVRGETQFLMDIAGDRPLAKHIADTVADHLIAIGLEELDRWNLWDTGIWIYDDMAFNGGTMFSPGQFEAVFLTAYRRMIESFKNAGARYVFLHSDGDIRGILDMLVDAGIDGINPLERRAGMDMTEIRKRYPRLILTGGMCNTRTLIIGTSSEIEAETRGIIDLGSDGGIIIGTHSVSPEIPLKNFVVYHETCMKYGDFSK